MDLHLIEAYGYSTAIVDNLNNLLTFGSNSNGQLGLGESLKPQSFENCYSSPQKANKNLILKVITQLSGNENTLGILTKQNDLYICGEFTIPLNDYQVEKVSRGLYSQNVLSPTLPKFLQDRKGKMRFQIKKFALTASSLALIANDSIS